MATRTDRIDFLILVDGTTIVTKMWKHPSDLRDIPHKANTYPPGEFDLASAIKWCKEHGFTVWTWPIGKEPMGARAWRGHPWPIRTAYQIIKKRRELEKLARENTYRSKYSNSTDSPGWDYRSLDRADLAYLAEPKGLYEHGAADERSTK